jgi:hypothetical protein
MDAAHEFRKRRAVASNAALVTPGSPQALPVGPSARARSSIRAAADLVAAAAGLALT